MSKYFFPILIFLPIALFSQKTKREMLDTASISLRAKFFTVSKHLGRHADLEDVKNLKSKTIETRDFVFVKVVNRYYCYDKGNHINFEWCDCEYYCCYSKKRKMLYLLGGFKNDDFEEFSEEFNHSITMTEYQKNINDKLLLNFLDFVVMKKYSQAKKVFKICVEKYN